MDDLHNEISICSEPHYDKKDGNGKIDNNQTDRLKKKRVKHSTGMFLKGVLGVCLAFSLLTFAACMILLQRPLSIFIDQMDRITRNQYHVLINKPFEIYPGLDLEQANFTTILFDHGFRRNDNVQLEERQFYQKGDVLYLKTEESGSIYKLKLDKGKITEIYKGENDKLVGSLNLPRQAISFFLHSVWEKRLPLSYEEFPRNLVEAVVATEDHNFFHHCGIDLLAIARAAVVNFKEGKITQGASTITQQLVKVVLERNERTWLLKVQEIVIAIIAEMRFSKEEILSAYLNNVYLGQVGRFEVRGVAMAADLIIGKRLSECTISEDALLAGLIRSPNSASPHRNPLAAVSRTKTVLDQMEEVDNFLVSKTIVSNYHRKITSAERVRASGYYFAALEKELQSKRLMPGALTPPLTIEVAFLPSLQENMADHLDKHLVNLERKKGLKRGTLQGAVVAIDVSDGTIMAMVGGRDYQSSPYDRALDASRQIGSLVKPFSYLVSLGGTGFSADLTQASMVSDTRIRVDYDRVSWKPRNYDGKYKGAITIREAIATSRNIPAVRVGLRGGLDRVADLLVDLSITHEPDRRPALLLGACESSPVAIGAAYSTLANGGKKVQPGIVMKVSTGGVVIWHKSQAQPFLSPAACYVMVDILKSVFQDGSGRSIAGFARQKNIAGKTGTTSKLRDAWFAGFTPEIALVVWIGRDDNKPVGFTGAGGALPLWGKCMESYLADHVEKDFVVPPDILFVRIDPRNGRPSDGHNKSSETMAFIQGTEPQAALPLHANYGTDFSVKL